MQMCKAGFNSQCYRICLPSRHVAVLCMLTVLSAEAGHLTMSICSGCLESFPWMPVSSPTARFFRSDIYMMAFGANFQMQVEIHMYLLDPVSVCSRKTR